MFKQIATPSRHNASAIGLAAVVTLVMLSSMNLLATQPHDEQLAQAGTPASMQVVVIEAQRSPRT
jgi:hypothetical protein